MGGQRYVYIAIFIVLAVVIGVRFFEYKVENNYIIFTYGECDPTISACFVYDCSLDPDPECDPSPYKKMLLVAATAPSCILENDCEEFECSDTQGCEDIYCSDEELDEGENCVFEEPINYTSDTYNTDFETEFIETSIEPDFEQLEGLNDRYDQQLNKDDTATGVVNEGTI